MLVEELEARRGQTLNGQLRVGAWVGIAISAHLTLTSIIFDAPAYPIDYWTRPGVVILAAIVLWALRLPLGTINPTRLALGRSILFCMAPALAGALGEDFSGNAMMIALISLVASALFPWGVGAQSTLSLSLFVMLLLARAWDPSTLASPNQAGVMNAVTGALVISVLLSFRTHYLFETMVRETLALRQARDQIEGLNSDLEETVQSRTQELDTALQDQRAFAYAVSHDIRQPLRHVDGYLHMFEEKMGHAGYDDDGDDLVGRSHEALRRARRILRRRSRTGHCGAYRPAPRWEYLGRGFSRARGDLPLHTHTRPIRLGACGPRATASSQPLASPRRTS
jgi:signal transduction histidine kinase